MRDRVELAQGREKKCGMKSKKKKKRKIFEIAERELCRRLIYIVLFGLIVVKI